jgi:hypothetical protein
VFIGGMLVRHVGFVDGSSSIPLFASLWMAERGDEDDDDDGAASYSHD